MIEKITPDVTVFLKDVDSETMRCCETVKSNSFLVSESLVWMEIPVF